MKCFKLRNLAVAAVLLAGSVGIAHNARADWEFVNQAVLCAYAQDGNTAERILNARLYANPQEVRVELEFASGVQHRKVATPFRITQLTANNNGIGGGYRISRAMALCAAIETIPRH